MEDQSSQRFSLWKPSTWRAMAKEDFPPGGGMPILLRCAYFSCCSLHCVKLAVILAERCLVQYGRGRAPCGLHASDETGCGAISLGSKAVLSFSSLLSGQVR